MQREIFTTVLTTALDYFLFHNESKAFCLYSTTMQHNSTFKIEDLSFQESKNARNTFTRISEKEVGLLWYFRQASERSQ